MGGSPPPEAAGYPVAVEGAAVAAAVAAPSAAAAAAVATAPFSAQLLHRHLSLSAAEEAELDQPRPADARLAAMAVLLVAVVSGAGLSCALAAMRLEKNDRTHLSSVSSTPDNAHNSKTPPSRHDGSLYIVLCSCPGASVSRSTTLL